MSTQDQAEELVFHLIQKGDKSGLAMFVAFTGHKVGAPELCAAVQRASQFGIDGEDDVGRMRVMRFVLDNMSFDDAARNMVGRLIDGVDGAMGQEALDGKRSSLRIVKSQLRLALQ
jgi:hypothetical protein